MPECTFKRPCKGPNIRAKPYVDHRDFLFQFKPSPAHLGRHVHIRDGALELRNENCLPEEMTSLFSVPYFQAHEI